MAKKHDLPYMPFYVGDWLKAPEVQCLSYELKGLWFEMLCYMWESVERGYLVDASGCPYSFSELSMLLRLPELLLKQKLEQLSSKKVFSVRESDKAIFSRRMVRDEEIRNLRKKAGSIGGKKTFAKANGQASAQAKDIANAENENENNINKEGVTGGDENSQSGGPNLSEVKELFLAKGYDSKNAELFWRKYESVGWEDTRGRPLKNWRVMVDTWIKRSIEFQQDKIPRAPTKTTDTASCTSPIMAKLLKGELNVPN